MKQKTADLTNRYRKRQGTLFSWNLKMCLNGKTLTAAIALLIYFFITSTCRLAYLYNFVYKPTITIAGRKNDKIDETIAKEGSRFRIQCIDRSMSWNLFENFLFVFYFLNFFIFFDKIHLLFDYLSFPYIVLVLYMENGIFWKYKTDLWYQEVL